MTFDDALVQHVGAADDDLPVTVVGELDDLAVPLLDTDDGGVADTVTIDSDDGFAAIAGCDGDGIAEDVRTVTSDGGVEFWELRGLRDGEPEAEMGADGSLEPPNPAN
jgi:hypothetical protein